MEFAFSCASGKTVFKATTDNSYLDNSNCGGGE